MPVYWKLISIMMSELCKSVIAYFLLKKAYYTIPMPCIQKSFSKCNNLVALLDLSVHSLINR